MPGLTLVIGLGGTGKWVLTYLKKDLINTYGGNVPPQVKLLSFDTVTQNTLAQSKVKEEKEARLGEVYLTPGVETFGKGGDTRPFCDDIVNKDFYPHISPWLSARRYLGMEPGIKGLSPADFDLGTGAGQYRQLGRMTVFMDAINPVGSTLYTNIQNAISALSNNPYAPTMPLTIFVVSSVAGGTGSSLFLDAGLIVRKFSENRGNTKIISILVLPNTFKKVTDSGPIYPNSYASMRELNRFIMTAGKNYKVIHRDPPDGNTTHINTAMIFDQCFFLDGDRSNNPLDVIPENSIYPSISDFILSNLDDNMRDKFDQAWRNISAACNSAAALRPAKKMWINTIGTFSYIFPVEDIIRSCVYRLCIDFISNYFVKIKSDNNSYSLGCNLDPYKEVQSFLTNPGQATFKTFANFTLANSLKQVEPASLSYDDLLSKIKINAPDNPGFDTKVNNVLDMRVSDKVETSKKSGDSLADGYDRILREVNDYKNDYLGFLRDQTSEERFGGKLRLTLQGLSDILLGQFNSSLIKEIKEHIDATSDSNLNASVRANGKNLGSAFKFLDILIDFLATFKSNMKESGETLRKTDWQEVLEARDGAMGQMRDSKDTPVGILNFFAVNSALNNQKLYIESEENLITVISQSYIYEALVELSQRMIDCINFYKRHLSGWTETFINLYKDFIAEQGKFDAIRSGLKDIKVRKYLINDQYEDKLYKQYINTCSELTEGKTPLDNLMNSHKWEWNLDFYNPANSNLGLKLYSIPKGQKQVGLTFHRETEHNVKIFFQKLEPWFEEIRQQTITKRLIAEFPNGGQDLALSLYRECGVFNIITNGARMKEYNFIGLHNSTDDGDLKFRTELQSCITAPMPRWTGKGSIDRLESFKNEYICTLTTIQALLELDEIKAYEDCKQPYHRLTDKTIHHIFPADINAAKYQDRLPEIGEKKRMFHTDVVQLMENIDLLKTFCMLFAFNQIESRDIVVNQATHQKGFKYFIKQGNICLNNEFTFTAPYDNFIEAAMNFMLGKEIIPPGINTNPKDIDFGKLQDIWRNMLRSKSGNNEFKKARTLNDLITGPINNLKASADQKIRDLASVFHLIILDEIKISQDNLGGLRYILDHVNKMYSYPFCYILGLIYYKKVMDHQLGTKTYNYFLKIGDKEYQLTKEEIHEKPLDLFLEATKSFFENNNCMVNTYESYEIRDVNLACNNLLDKLSEGNVQNKIDVLKKCRDEKLKDIQTYNQIQQNKEIGILINFINSEIDREIEDLKEELSQTNLS